MFDVIQLSTLEKSIVVHTKSHGNKETLLLFKDFYRKDPNRNRRLIQLVKRDEAVKLKSEHNIVQSAILHGNTNALRVHSNFLKGDKNRSRNLNDLLRKFKNGIVAFDRSKLCTEQAPNSCSAPSVKVKSVKQSLTQKLKAARRYSIGFTKIEIFNRIKVSHEQKIKRNLKDALVTLPITELQRIISKDNSLILRRFPRDLLPCKARRLASAVSRIRYEDEDEEDCWESVLLGGKNEETMLTLEDRLLFPASVRSKKSFIHLFVVDSFKVRFIIQVSVHSYRNCSSYPHLTNNHCHFLLNCAENLTCKFEISVH